MPGPLIRLGDKTPHNGNVLDASRRSDNGGKGIARMGDKTSRGATLIAGQQNSIDHL